MSPYTNGKLVVVSGPVGSDKSGRLESTLDAEVDSGCAHNGSLLLVRHPSDDPFPQKMGQHNVDVVTASVDSVVEKITPGTKRVFIAGASHYGDNIISLADALVRSGRKVVASGLNLDAQGNPHGSMPGLMAIADQVVLARAYCAEVECNDGMAMRTRAEDSGNYEPVCAHHYTSPGSPTPAQDETGFLWMSVGSMFSGKTTEWRRQLGKVKKSGQDPIVLTWLNNARYGQDETPPELFSERPITTHKRGGSEADMATLVRNTGDIVELLGQHPKRKVVFLDETQFFGEGDDQLGGIYRLVNERVPQGYRFFVNGLPRGFNRGPFLAVPPLMALADSIDMGYARCVVKNGGEEACGHPATDNQRMIREDGGDPRPAHKDDSLKLIGGADTGEPKLTEFYQARCIKHWVLDGENPNRYQLPEMKK